MNDHQTVKTEARLRILQYNVQFLAPWNSAVFVLPYRWFGHWPNTEERARAIGQAVAGYDIVVLNEMVNSNRREQFLSAMSEAARECRSFSLVPGAKIFDMVHGHDLDQGFRLLSAASAIRNMVQGKPDKPLVGNGLTIISRLPIINVHSHVFTARAGLDALAQKGVLHARLWDKGWVSGSEAIDLFATHLQASGKNIRCNQIRELADFIQMHSEPNIPTLLLGDLNIDGSPGAQDQPGSEYISTMQILEGELGLRDIGRNLGGTNYDPDPKKHRKQRIDYIFTSCTLAVDSVRVQEFPNARWGTLSDHAGIEAKIGRPD